MMNRQSTYMDRHTPVSDLPGQATYALLKRATTLFCAPLPASVSVCQSRLLSNASKLNFFGSHI